MGNKIDKGLILDRIKFAFNLSGNSELARFLGVAPNTVTNWYNRNSLDFDVVFTKCENINLNWLFTGSGSVHINEVHDREACEDLDSASLIRDLINKTNDLSRSLGEVTRDNENLSKKNGELRSNLAELKKMYSERVGYSRRDPVYNLPDIAAEPDPEE